MFRPTPKKDWKEPTPPPQASLSQIKEYEEEAQRLRELRQKHEEWVLWTKGG